MKKILLVEDNDFIRKMYLMKLAKSNEFEIIEAADGAAALDATRKQRPDLILLDIMMPKMSGLDVLQQLRKEGSQVPVIILSNVMSAATKAQAEKYGVVDYIIKSDLTPSQVLKILQAHLG